MQQMERLLFEEFRGQQELDSGRRNRLDGGNQLLEKRKHRSSTRTRRAINDQEVVQRAEDRLNHVVNPAD
jgi:hypothetical protein